MAPLVSVPRAFRVARTEEGVGAILYVERRTYAAGQL
jgi:hypothetical protein